MQQLQLGVLDLVNNIDETLSLAKEVEELGYSRYWVAEHAPQPDPSLICSILASRTKRIIVGTAGILLHAYSPARIAYNFQFMEKLYPNRIEAGFCAGWFPDSVLDDYLDGRSPLIKQDREGYETKAARFIDYVRQSESLEKASLWPDAPSHSPQIFCLGTGERSALIAARHQTAYGFSLFHHFSKPDPSIIRTYCENYRSDGPSNQPKPFLAVAVACAEDEKSAQLLADSYKSKAIIPTIIGTPQACWRRLQEMSETYKTNNIIILDVGTAYKQRLDTYTLLAREVDLNTSSIEN